MGIVVFYTPVYLALQNIKPHPMKTRFLILVLAGCGIMFPSCSNDEPMTPVAEDPMDQAGENPSADEGPSPEEVLASERQETVSTLTDDAQKTWRISSAMLTNTNGTFDISANFNITDDEFIFNQAPLTTAKSFTEFEGSVEWRKANAIALMATSEEEALLDFYLPPQTYAFDFKEESSTDLRSDGANFDFSIQRETEIDGTITFEEGTLLDVVLTPKLGADYKQVPTDALQFTELFTFESDAIANSAPGMMGSMADNSLFIATRETQVDGVFVNSERVIKFDLDTETVTERLNNNSDFVSKQLHIINGQLTVVGAQRINSYGLDIGTNPVPSQDYATLLGFQNFGLSRFGSAVLGNDVYLVGGELDNTFTNRIFRFNTAEESISEFATMPEARFGARAEIVNNKLYIFGGSEEFLSPPAKNTIYSYNIESGELATANMPQGLILSYTAKVENLIYVAGRMDIFEGNTLTDIGFYLAVYDTVTGTFTELNSNLESPEFETIHAMAVLADKLYVIFGQTEETTEDEKPTWAVLAADI